MHINGCQVTEKDYGSWLHLVAGRILFYLNDKLCKSALAQNGA